MGRVLNLLPRFRRTQTENSSGEVRSAERGRRIAFSALVGVAAKFVAIMVPIVTVPITLGYLGREQYGIWITLTTLATSLGFADLGLGLGLMNMVSKSHGAEDLEAARSYISSAFFLLLFLSLALIFSYWIVAPHLDWSALFHAKSPTTIEALPKVMWIVVLCFLIGLPLSVVDRVCFGFQEAFWSFGAQLISNCLAIAGLLFAVHLRLGLVGIVTVTASLPVIGLAINGLILFLKRRPHLRPGFRHVQNSAVKELFSSGLLFFVLQICVAVSYSSDNLVISGVKGVNSVTDYSIPSKLFGLVQGLLPVLLAPVWPAMSEAAASGDKAWVRTTFRKTLVLTSGITAFVALVLLVTGKAIVLRWTHGVVNPSFLLLATLALWTIIGSMANVTSIFLNALNILKVQVYLGILTAVINIILSIELTRLYGPAGVAMGSITACIILLVILFRSVLPGVLRDLGSHEQPLEISMNG